MKMKMKMKMKMIKWKRKWYNENENENENGNENENESENENENEKKIVTHRSISWILIWMKTIKIMITSTTDTITANVILIFVLQHVF